MNRAFIKGLDLSEVFYEEGVRPILATRFPKVPYSAALLGSGSDILGFDTPQSTDHDWGPKLMVFLTEADHAAYRDEINRVLRYDLPREVRGYPTDFGRHNDGTAVMTADASGPINHGVSFFTVLKFFRFWLNSDPSEELRAIDWLTIPEQILRGLTGGRVFHDGLSQLEPLRARLRYYPHDVWLYLLATQWNRISQEEAFMGRCGQVGDEVGSCLVAARLVRDLMKLCFLMERQYAPYIKWFGTAFAQLDCADELLPTLTQVLGAGSWQERERHLSLAYGFVARMHNELGITKALLAQVSQFHNRPFLVIHGERFADAIRATITDEEVLALPENLGGIDQFVDSTDVLSQPGRYGRLRLMYQQGGQP
jgi:hypothetical protein